MSKPIYILGISCFYHDASACLIKDGVLIAAAEEERFTRKKHDNSFPENAIEYCLKEAGINAGDLSAIGFYEKPLLKFERILEMAIDSWPFSYRAFMRSVPSWLRQKLWIKDTIRKELGYKGEIYFIEHHLSHAASSYLVSPFDEAAIFTVDAVGEWATTTIGYGRNKTIETFAEINFPHSLGLLYSIITHFIGFKPNSAEYKVMGLAPYGKPTYIDQLKKLIDIKDDGSFNLNLDYFAFHKSLNFYNDKTFEKLFGFPQRKKGEPLEQRHKDLAMSIQRITEEAILKTTQYLHQKTGSKNLCMAGGVALNCVANGRILRETPFENIFIQPAAGDSGGALGVAFYIWTNILDKDRAFEFKDVFWGPGYSEDEIEQFLQQKGCIYHKLSREKLLDTVAELIDGTDNVIGWFQGRMEWGPRALGNRSILADARNPENKDRVNLKIKFREDFRPFAPTVLEEDVSKYFDLDVPSPYMLLVAQVQSNRRTIPAITHIDGSARPQTVNREENELYYDLIKTFEKRTGCPVIINTSFNLSGEPIVRTPEEAWNVFQHTNMDYLVLGSFLIKKEEIKNQFPRDQSWKDRFEPD